MRMILVAAVCAVAISACATQPRFEYGSYEATLYAYYKKPELRERYESGLEKAINRGEKQGRLAPGLYAELGYLRFQDGDGDAAVEHFQQEMTSFPQATFFMEKVISRITGAPVDDSGSAEDGVETEAPAASTDYISEEAVG